MISRLFVSSLMLLPPAMVLSAGAAAAVDQRILKELMQLTPQERMEQRCDIEAMERIKHEQKGFFSDKVIAYTFSEPEISGEKIKAPGAVFRSKGEWYRLKFKCETARSGSTSSPSTTRSARSCRVTIGSNTIFMMIDLPRVSGPGQGNGVRLAGPYRALLAVARGPPRARPGCHNSRRLGVRCRG